MLSEEAVMFMTSIRNVLLPAYAFSPKHKLSKPSGNDPFPWWSRNSYKQFPTFDWWIGVSVYLGTGLGFGRYDMNSWLRSRLPGWPWSHHFISVSTAIWKSGTSFLPPLSVFSFFPDWVDSERLPLMFTMVLYPRKHNGVLMLTGPPRCHWNIRKVN